ncbi:MAG: iron chelate uptake ABC transporter family permease subunit [Humibacillus sp.]|nr:iron chelate uptake ABC transporter family permease subunit [Humibacillus sp.]MDN5779361.1 iron chelate uptake ABC transporter family permease subunit [Humibacillus sp.]
MGLAALCAAGWLSLGVGVAGVGVADLLSPTDEQLRILTTSRIPRLIAIVLAGASLSIAGLIMQRITQNRFVSPSTSGTTEAAVLGVLIATLVFGSTSLTWKMLIAIGFAIGGTMLFLQMLSRIRHRDGLVVALVGLMYGGVIAAATTFVAYQRDLLQFLEIWTAGSFSGVIENRYEALFIVAPVALLGYLFADRFTVVGLGADFATNLGVNYQRVLYSGLVIVSMISAVVVVVIGAIPFLGLIVPNIVTLWMGDNLRRVLPVTALAGAGFVLACDVAGRLIRYPYEISASTLAGIIGGVVFIGLIMRAADRAGAR